MQTKEYLAGEENIGDRIDKFISQADGELTRSAVVKLIEDGSVTVNGAVPSKNLRLRAGDRILVTLSEPVLPEARPQNIPLDIVYEDDDLLVVNKPRGMVVHPAAGNPEGTLVNALLYHCSGSLSGINGVLRPGIVHRIDKDTSGLLIVAKNDRSHRLLAEQIKEHSFMRKYQAVVTGVIKEESGTVNAPIGRHQTDRKKMTVTLKNSREAVTHYRVLQRYKGYTHIELTLETGRTHQIRVHMAYIHHPLVGDELYGPRKQAAALEGVRLSGQLLHAGVLGFIHPRTGSYMEFRADLPEMFAKIIDRLRQDK